MNNSEDLVSILTTLIWLTSAQHVALNALPSLLQATKYMAVVDILSTHSPDEEYLGERQQPSVGSSDPEMIEAFYAFSAKIRQNGMQGEREKRKQRIKTQRRRVD